MVYTKINYYIAIFGTNIQNISHLDHKIHGKYHTIRLFFDINQVKIDILLYII